MELTKIFYSINEASEITGLSYRAIRNMAYSNAAPHITSGNKVLINMPMFLEYLKELSNKKAIHVSTSCNECIYKNGAFCDAPSWFCRLCDNSLKPVPTKTPVPEDCPEWFKEMNERYKEME